MFLCCRASPEDFCQTAAVRGCGVTESATWRPDAHIPVKTFVYLVCQEYDDFQAEPEF